MEQAGNALAVQRFITHGPANNLAHALHLVKAREVHQHRERCKELHAFGKAAKHGERAGDILIIINAELVHVIALIRHFLIIEEGRIFGLWNTNRIQQVRISSDVHRFHIGKGRQHHLHFSRLEHAAIFVVIAILHLNIGLREEAENLRQQIALMLANFLRPIAAILAQRHFFGQPVDLLLALPEIIGPRIFKGLVGLARFKKRHVRRP